MVWAVLKNTTSNFMEFKVYLLLPHSRGPLDMALLIHIIFDN